MEENALAGQEKNRPENLPGAVGAAGNLVNQIPPSRGASQTRSPAAPRALNAPAPERAGVADAPCSPGRHNGCYVRSRRPELRLRQAALCGIEHNSPLCVWWSARQRLRRAAKRAPCLCRSAMTERFRRALFSPRGVVPKHAKPICLVRPSLLQLSHPTNRSRPARGEAGCLSRRQSVANLLRVGRLDIVCRRSCANMRKLTSLGRSTQPLRVSATARSGESERAWGDPIEEPFTPETDPTAAPGRG